MSGWWWLIIGMALVTYLPRLIPMAFWREMSLPPRIRTFLEYIPYAALGALIFPGVINSTGDTRSALGGALVAIITAWLGMNILIVLSISVIAVYLIKLI